MGMDEAEIRSLSNPIRFQPHYDGPKTDSASCGRRVVLGIASLIALFVCLLWNCLG